MPRPIDSRSRIVAAAAREFARHGFAGTSVDRVAAQARLNKAMIYYHFRSKLDLYRSLLRDTFAAVADRLETIRAADLAVEAKIDAFIEALADIVATRPHFPAIWLREMAEGGRHLDPLTFGTLAEVPRALAAIVDEGIRNGRFRPVNPLTVHFTLVGALMLFFTSRPLRERFGPAARLPFVEGAEMIAHLKGVARDMLRADGGTRGPDGGNDGPRGS